MRMLPLRPYAKQQLVDAILCELSIGVRAKLLHHSSAFDCIATAGKRRVPSRTYPGFCLAPQVPKPQPLKPTTWEPRRAYTASPPLPRRYHTGDNIWTPIGVSRPEPVRSEASIYLQCLAECRNRQTLPLWPRQIRINRIPAAGPTSRSAPACRRPRRRAAPRPRP